MSIGFALIAAQLVSSTAVTPEEFRREVALHHVCFTDKVMEDTGYREMGFLYLDRGENLPNVALVRAQKDLPPLFEKGVVTAARRESEADKNSLIAFVEGERGGQPANLEIRLSRKKGDGLSVKLSLSQDGRDREYFCGVDPKREKDK